MGLEGIRSPQARGSTGPSGAYVRLRRPIPAGAGLNRTPPARRTAGGTDPRRRGAQPSTRKASCTMVARSPQARGSTVLTQRMTPARVPIPAGAGLNRQRNAAMMPAKTDPRRRGAQPRSPWPGTTATSRSPQARGSTGPRWRLPGLYRPIPAGAGLNRAPISRDRAGRADPRRRGAQPLGDPDSIFEKIRSPQARGSTDADADQLGAALPIPAGAGLNRKPASPRARGSTDPRRRGAQPKSVSAASTASRRSPQARGSTGLGLEEPGAGLPIPAGAGLNRNRRYYIVTGPADPRRRGAQPLLISVIAAGLVRSPQARGSTVDVADHRVEFCPIPAGAGLNRCALAGDPCR